MSFNWPKFTDEVRYTDRVLAFPRGWPRTVATGLQRIDTSLLYSTVTGDPGSVDHFPLNGARWHTLPRDFAVLVAENRRDRFAAELFHFGSAPRDLGVSLFTLEPGRYRWTLTALDDRVLTSDEHVLSPNARTLRFTLPARTGVRLSMEKQP